MMSHSGSHPRFSQGPRPQNASLTPKQARFVSEYLVDLNATAAYGRAGFRGSAGTRSVEASKLLRKRAVAAAISERIRAREARVAVKADRVLSELACIAFADIGNLYDARGHLLPIGELSGETRAALASIEVEEVDAGDGVGRTSKIRFWDKLRALELLGKHLGLFAEKADGGGGRFLTIAVIDPYAKQ